MQSLKSSAYLDRKLHFIQGICRYVALSDSEYKLQPVKIDVIFFIKQLGLIIFERSVSLSPNYFGPNSATLEKESSYTIALLE